MMKQNLSCKFLPTAIRTAAVAAVIVPLLILLAASANAQSGGRGGANVRANRGAIAHWAPATSTAAGWPATWRTAQPRTACGSAFDSVTAVIGSSSIAFRSRPR